MPLEVGAQVVIGGLLVGGLYALVAFGLSLIYGVVRILNFAHGTVLAVCGVAASMIFASYGLHPVLIACILAVGVFAVAYVYYMILLNPLSKRSHFEATVGTVLVTVGTLIALSDLTAHMAGSTSKNIPLRFEAIEFGDIVVSTTQLGILLGIALLSIVMQLILKHTWFGRSVRAVTQSQMGASVCGVNSTRIKALTFAFGSAVAAVAAVLYVLSFPVDPYMGFGMTVKAFTIIVVGGIGNLPGALLAGVFLGVAEGLTGLYWKPEWAPAISVMLMLLILVTFAKKYGAKHA
ncbi:MAG: branched-chain amino acid ABC transporter permease [Alcaligenaceae bacterium]|nr:branched-chain amino acid ABC transporter permease [Alcaligenaceae bacterium]